MDWDNDENNHGASNSKAGNVNMKVPLRPAPFKLDYSTVKSGTTV